MVDDNLLDQASVSYLFSRNSTNADYLLQSGIGAAINAACASGLFTCTYVATAFAQALREAMVQRLVNMGYGASITGTSIVVTWANVL
jgi:hypothetical protein